MSDSTPKVQLEARSGKDSQAQKEARALENEDLEAEKQRKEHHRTEGLRDSVARVVNIAIYSLSYSGWYFSICGRSTLRNANPMALD